MSSKWDLTFYKLVADEENKWSVKVSEINNFKMKNKFAFKKCNVIKNYTDLHHLVILKDFQFLLDDRSYASTTSLGVLLTKHFLFITMNATSE